MINSILSSRYITFGLSFKSLYSICCPLWLLIFFTSCYDTPKPDLSNPTYMESLIDETSRRVHSQGLDACIRYIDSFRAAYNDTGAVSGFHFYWLYYDLYNRNGRKDSAELYADSMLLILERSPYFEDLHERYIQANYYKADLLLDQKRYKEAYRYYYNALMYAEKYQDTCASAYYHFKLGLVMYGGEQYTDACRYFIRSYNETYSCNDDFSYFFRRQQTLNNIGLCYQKTKLYDSAVDYFNKSLSLIDYGKKILPENKHHLLRVATAIVNGNLGEVYAELGNVEKAEELYKNSIAVNSIDGGDKTDAQYTRIKLANLYVKSGRYKEAIDILNIVKVWNDTVQHVQVKSRWHRAMWQYWDALSNPVGAYAHLVSYVDLTKNQTSFQEKYSMADIDNQVRNLKTNLTISNLKERESTNNLYLIVALIICILAFVIVLLMVQNTRRSKRHITVLKQMNERINEQKVKLSGVLQDLEQADKEKDRILKAVSHDMRSPINSALALVDILTTQSDNLNDEQKEYVSLIKKSNENALNLTKDLLEVATLNSEKLDKTPVDITAIIKERVMILGYKAAEKRQTLNFKAPDNHITAVVNEEKLLRVVNNLVTNAIKFSSINDEIDIELSNTEDSFTLMVKDKGIGIPEKMKETVFDLFSEAKRFGTSGEQPFGLGLSISKQIVEAHGGVIWFESEEGSGTTFYVKIPL